MLIFCGIFPPDHGVHLEVCQEDSSEYDVRTVEGHHVSCTAFFFFGDVFRYMFAFCYGSKTRRLRPLSRFVNVKKENMMLLTCDTSLLQLLNFFLSCFKMRKIK